MNNYLKISTADKIVPAIEANISAWIPVFGKLGQVCEDNPSGVTRSITRYPVPVFNSIMDTRLAPEQTDGAIRSIVSDAEMRNIPVQWWIFPSTQPSDLADRLKIYGFSSEFENPGMAADLNQLDASQPKPEGFSIRLAQDDFAWKQWSQTMQIGFNIPMPDEMRIQAWWDLLRQSDPNIMSAITGFLHDEPVSTSLLFLAGGVAGIYWVATIPEARRRGIGAWMTLSPLRMARSIGYNVGVLFASKMGQNIYRRIGFQQFCTIARYQYFPKILDNPSY